jgi:hypothetical protein
MSIDYAAAQRQYRTFKSTLTRRVNAKDWPGVIALWHVVNAYYEDPSHEPWPDDWHRWERAADDAQFALQRAEVYSWR